MSTKLDVETIRKIVEKVTDQEVEKLDESTHLVEEEVVDSLDSAVFLLEVEKLTNLKLSDKDVEEKDLFKVSNLLGFVNGAN